MFHKSMIVVAMLAAGICLGGCNKDNVRAPEGIRTDPLAGGYPQNVALNGLHNSLVVDQPIVEPRSADRPMRVTVPLRSVAEGTLRVQYRFILLDDRGRPVRSNQEGWRYQVIARRTQVFVETSALDTDAVDWRLEVRSAQ
jgi:hypothetical protein